MTSEADPQRLKNAIDHALPTPSSAEQDELQSSAPSLELRTRERELCRKARVESLRQAFANGTYERSAEEIATAILRDEQWRRAVVSLEIACSRVLGATPGGGPR